MQTLQRLSLNRAVELLQAKRAERRARAQSIAGAIDTLQKYAKAKRDFIGMACCCPLIAALFAYNGEPLTGMFWLINAPILVLHLRKAYVAKEQARNLLRSGLGSELIARRLRYREIWRQGRRRR
ncbi:hypothetical protein [Brevundimonas naejangsanensis]|uniref:hypothetical protein n=1 Tax=Brevundimonas naejangsanensis TaxID=588932 RepID=UPI0026EF9D30|nr:hypothetical protein [Brevundimonas naejangsanensis]